MTRARVKALHDKVNSILATLDLDTPLDGMLPHAETLCVIRYKDHQGYEEEEAPFIKEEEITWCKKLEEMKKKEEMRREGERKKEDRRKEGEGRRSAWRQAHGRRQAGTTSTSGLPATKATTGSPGLLLAGTYRRAPSLARQGRYRLDGWAGTSGLGTARGTAHTPQRTGYSRSKTVFFRYLGRYLRRRHGDEARDDEVLRNTERLATHHNLWTQRQEFKEQLTLFETRIDEQYEEVAHNFSQVNQDISLLREATDNLHGQVAANDANMERRMDSLERAITNLGRHRRHRSTSSSSSSSQDY
ncbi:hypothetical protein QYE76_057104 [Lolium multiflorum]|uniref:Uncharacterized protein n=1 Tax=Lolium multiflorum TaxID=4521 RepID=A0AAD8T3S6_LOLMU|nr:hypothetical protein QYE76_057104 [Lolium multiflorum]